MAHLALGLSLLLLAGSACYADSIDLQLQHSLDGGRSFVKAGSISGQGQDVELVRTATPGAHDLAKLVESDGFYVVRVPTGKAGQFASASVRAACLAANPAAEQLQVAVDDNGAVLSLSYALEGVPSAACKATASPGIPERSTVSVQRPSEGPSVLSPQALGAFEQGVFSGEGSTPGAAPRSRDSQGGPSGRPRGIINKQPGAGGEKAAGGDGAGPGEEGAPPPEEEKTWLQKNWLMVLGVSMAVMNIVGNIGRAQQGGAGGAGGAAAAGAAGGGAAARAGGARRG